jgi:hypothetical protein
MWMQRHERACRTYFFCTRDDLGDEVLMPAMNPVECTDGENGGAGEVDCGEIVYDFHILADS